MTARLVITLLLALGSAAAQPTTVQISVLSLFRPHQLTLRTVDNGIIRFAVRGASNHSLEGRQTAALKAQGDNILATIDGRTVAGEQLLIDHSTEFELSVPGKLSRRYSGSLKITAHNGRLLPVVTMEIETAVAAVLAAESDLNGPLEALIAQAIASRSYLAAGRRHESFDFCDTTHCQYLTDSFNKEARRIASASNGILLWSHGRVFRALFTRSCDGRTRTPQQLGLPGGAPYQAVTCPICARRPHHWSRAHALADVTALIRNRTEKARLNVGRQLGWDAIPSNAYQATVDGDTVTFHGTGEGHGIGLCQRGSVGLAIQGATWRAILQRYFPGAVVSVAARP